MYILSLALTQNFLYVVCKPAMSYISDLNYASSKAAVDCDTYHGPKVHKMDAGTKTLQNIMELLYPAFQRLCLKSSSDYCASPYVTRNTSLGTISKH